MELKAQRSQLRNRKENVEGSTYKSNMSLFQKSEQSEGCIKIIPRSDSLQFSIPEMAIVFFDLETGRLDYNSREILQVCMKYENLQFDAFVTPTKSIDPQATKINGLSRVHKQLFLNGKELYLKNLCTSCLNL
uniref:Exonuclease domain-containing protein n=1 Tax=Trichogramma kaykai TaxID=54128 RepID=A0ABD2VW63_9HYME